ncbi:hypothetical protein GW17_00041691 [Ensete ventricosum]|nr:hypothetical protein GW17_00041691 [Ensete ventricosum]
MSTFRRRRAHNLGESLRLCTPGFAQVGNVCFRIHLKSVKNPCTKAMSGRGVRCDPSDNQVSAPDRGAIWIEYILECFEGEPKVPMYNFREWLEPALVPDEAVRKLVWSLDCMPSVNGRLLANRELNACSIIRLNCLVRKMAPDVVVPCGCPLCGVKAATSIACASSHFTGSHLLPPHHARMGNCLPSLAHESKRCDENKSRRRCSGVAQDHVEETERGRVLPQPAAAAAPSRRVHATDRPRPKRSVRFAEGGDGVKDTARVKLTVTKKEASLLLAMLDDGRERTLEGVLSRLQEARAGHRRTNYTIMVSAATSSQIP